MVQPDNTPAVTGVDAGASVTPAEGEPAPDAAAESDPTPDTEVPTDDDIVDAELVPAPIAPAPIPPTTPIAAPVPAPAFDYTDAGVPTLGYLQDKIERRYGNALGGTELAGATPEAQSAATAQEQREKAAADKLEEIRRSLHPDS